MVGQLTETQIVYVLAGLSGADPRVVKRYRQGEQIRESVRERIELAARYLAQLQGSAPAASAQR